MKNISVLIVEDHLLLRELLVDLFDKNEKFTAISQSANCQEAIEVMGALKPDIVLLDLNLPDGSGLDLIPIIRKKSKKSKIVVLSMYGHPAYAKKVISLGGHAYLTKNASQQEILTAIDIVLNDEHYICDEIKHALSLLLTSQAKQPDLGMLSLREKEVLHYLKQGLTSRKIAELMHITLKTVQAHRHNIFKKLGVRNITTLINYVNQAELNAGNI